MFDMVIMTEGFSQDLNLHIYKIFHMRNASGKLSFPFLVVARNGMNQFDLQIGSHCSNTTIIKMV